MNETETNTQAGSQDAKSRKIHPWNLAYAKIAKLKAARHEAKKRYALKYRNDNIEERRLLERHWHRKKLNLPLEAPKMKAWDYVKGRVTG